jgi:hypothetical protein
MSKNNSFKAIHEMKSFEEFWPFYLHEHLHPMNRGLHLFGSFFSLLLLGYFAYHQAWIKISYCFLVGYTFAWIGHFFIEHNRPATFKAPFWSFAGDWKMFYFFTTGRLKSEFKRFNLD